MVISDSARDALVVISGALTQTPGHHQMAKMLANIVEFGDPCPKATEAKDRLMTLIRKVRPLIGDEEYAQAIQALHLIADQEQRDRWRAESDLRTNVAADQEGGAL